MEVYWDHPQWDYIDPLPDQGMYRIQKDGKWGIIDENQQFVIPCHWEYIGLFCGDFIFVKERGLWGILRLDGTVAVTCEWFCITDVPDEPGCFILSGKDESGTDKTCKVDLHFL